MFLFMKIESYFDLKCLISYEMAHYERVQKRATCLKNAHFLFSHEVWNGIKEEIVSTQNNMQYYKEIIDNATTFEGGDFASFLTYFISDEDDFQLYRIENLKLVRYDKKDSKETFYFFGSKKSYKRLLKHKNELNTSANLEKLLHELHIFRGFIIKKEPIHLSLDSQLDRMRASFPRFCSVWESLIDCYLKYPKKSSKERLDMVLREYKNLSFSFLLNL